ncbi:hypothetical protein AB0J86_27855 [Micromonospora sp. NPDC049559]|uniref:hypothetical protein n=1 Tax=Micromonospora sp. NPDC049559 TaxID=3155923 RepID=UPI003426F672
MTALVDHNSPQEIARRRTVAADVVLDGVDLDGYPHRHLGVFSKQRFAHAGITEILAAADVLARSGWELVQVGEFGKGTLLCAVLRRA